MKKTIAAVAVGLSIAFSAMSFGGQASAQTISSSSQVAQHVINVGMKYLGTPYQFGASLSDTSHFDCSSFTHKAFLEGAGINLPRDSRGQAAYVKSHGNYTTDWHNLKPGDLVFFMSYKGTSQSAYAGINKSTARITHVAIYLGDGKILHTFGAGGVRVSKFAGTNWEYRFVGGGSVIKR